MAMWRLARTVTGRQPLVNSDSLRKLHLTAVRRFEVKDEQDFSTRVVNSHLPVVVAFHATWCGPCKSLAPVLEECVNNTAGRVDLARVDVDQLTDIAMSYKVKSVPAVFGLREGQVVEQFAGLQSREFVEEFVHNLLSSNSPNC